MITWLADELRRWMAEVVILYLVVVAGGLTVLAGALLFLRMYVRFRGPKVVRCPETGCAAVVEIDALHATLGELLGDRDIHLMSCSRWPLPGGNCQQPCVRGVSGKVAMT